MCWLFAVVIVVAVAAVVVILVVVFVTVVVVTAAATDVCQVVFSGQPVRGKSTFYGCVT